MSRIVALVGIFLASAQASSQAPTAGVVAPVCVQGIGACQNVAGLRMASRARGIERVVGVNLTAWLPHKPTTGRIVGVAIGLPATGSEYITGIAVAPALLTARTRLSGLGAAGIAIAVNGEAQAIVLSGVVSVIGDGMAGVSASGIGTLVGGNATGLLATGAVGVVTGRMTGIAVSGFGLGLGEGGTGIVATTLGGAIGGPFTGLAVAGLGYGGAGSLTGLTVAGFGVGLRGDLRGISAVGMGAGVGGSATGLVVAGLGITAREAIDGIAIAGGGIGAPRISKAAIAPLVVTSQAHALVIAPLYFRARQSGGDASARGVFVSAVNDVRGEQSGLSIGILNYARSLNGVQIGLLNIVADGRSPRMLPVANWR